MRRKGEETFLYRMVKEGASSSLIRKCRGVQTESLGFEGLCEKPVKGGGMRRGVSGKENGVHVVTPGMQRSQKSE